MLDKNNNGKDFLIVLSIGLFVVILIIFLIIYFQEQNMSNYVHHTNCYAPISDYSVEPGKSSTSILTNCGPNKNSRCCNNSASLKDAVVYVQSFNGQKFSYVEKTGFTCIIDPTNTVYNNNDQTNIYTATRFNINQDINGATLKNTDVNTNTNITATPVDSRSLQTQTQNYSI